MLESHHWNRQLTAEQLGINRTTLYKKMKRLGLEDHPKARETAQVEKGKQLYTANACDYCHGPGAERWTMGVPDLRKASPATHDEFLGVVIGGSRASKGMPRFNTLTPDEGEALRAFILDRAWAAYNAQQAAAQGTR